MRIGALVTLVAMAVAGDASAQGTYISASVLADVVRTTHTEVSGVSQPSGGGEAIGVALRVGTPLGAAWGVEAEFAYPSEIEESFDSSPIRLLADDPRLTTVSSLLPTIYPPLPYVFQTRIRQRTSTLSAAVWVQQQLTGRASLVYLGGLGFYRSTRESELEYPFLAAAAVARPPFVSEYVAYGVRPFAGFESRLLLTDHVQIVPGVRLHGIEDGWLLRPSVGIGWVF